MTSPLLSPIAARLQDRWPTVGAVLVTIGCFAAPATGAAPVAWSLVAAACGAVGLLRPRAAAPVVPYAAALLAYLGAAGVAAPIVTLFAAALGYVVLRLVETADEASPAAATAMAVASAVLVLVAWVLSRGGFDAELLLLLRLAAGVAFGVVTYEATRRLMLSPGSGGRLPVWFAAAVVTVAALGAAGRAAFGPVPATAMPASRAVAARLASFDAQPTPEVLAHLDALWAAGDAAWGEAFAGLMVSHNADPELLRDRCPDARSTDVLTGVWREMGRIGRHACLAVRDWPELGASELLSLGLPPLARLAADLSADAGDLPAALGAYGHAAGGADPFACDDAVAMLDARGRLAEFQAVLARVGCGDESSGIEEAWRRWNARLDFAAGAVPGRAGIERLGPPFVLRQVYDHSIESPVVVATGRRLGAWGVRLPATPSGQLPTTVELRVRGAGSVAMSMTGQDGAVMTWACGRGRAATEHPLPDEACRETWATVRVEVPRFSSFVASIDLHFGPRASLASVAATAPKEQPL